MPQHFRMQSLSVVARSCIPVDVVLHPRDLNLVFIAYGGKILTFFR